MLSHYRSKQYSTKTHVCSQASPKISDPRPAKATMNEKKRRKKKKKKKTTNNTPVSCPHTSYNLPTCTQPLYPTDAMIFAPPRFLQSPLPTPGPSNAPSYPPASAHVPSHSTPSKPCPCQQIPFSGLRTDSRPRRAPSGRSVVRWRSAAVWYTQTSEKPRASASGVHDGTAQGRIVGRGSGRHVPLGPGDRMRLDRSVVGTEDRRRVGNPATAAQAQRELGIDAEGVCLLSR